MADSLARRIEQKQIKSIIGGLAQTNYYQVNFSSLTPEIEGYLRDYSGVGNVKQFLSEKAGIYCTEAVLPTSALATAEVKDNFMGVPQEFAHTRLYTDIDFTFYIDQDYTLLKIFEGWMEYIASGANRDVTQLHRAYYRRMRYPDTYKVHSMYITKFEKNYEKELRWRFINAFPKAMTNIPVTYGPADLLKVTVSFNYDRYVVIR